MSFSFNFDVGDGENATMDDSRDEDTSVAVPADVIPAAQLAINAETIAGLPSSEGSNVDAIVVGKQLFKKCIFSGDSTGLGGVVEKSDLEAGRYEGGFKVWECAVDMLQCLDKNFPSSSPSNSVPVNESEAHCYPTVSVMTDLQPIVPQTLVGKRVADSVAQSKPSVVKTTQTHDAISRAAPDRGSRRKE